MRLLHIIASMDPVKGGPCQSIRSSIPELERLGVHNDVACLDNPDALFLKTDPFIIHAFGPSKTPWCYSARLMPWLLENLCRFLRVRADPTCSRKGLLFRAVRFSLDSAVSFGTGRKSALKVL